MSEANYMYPMQLLNILYEGIDDFKGLRLLVAFTMDSYEYGDVSPIDELLAEADFSRMDPIFSTGIIRYTFAKQGYLKNWVDARERVVEDLKRRGLDWEYEMMGLFEEYRESPAGAALDSMLGVHHTLIPNFD